MNSSQVTSPAVISRISTPAVFVALCFLGLFTVAFSGAMLIGSLLNGHAPWAPVEACCGGAVAEFSLGWLLLSAIGLISGIALVRATFSLTALVRASRRIGDLKRLAARERIAGSDCWVLEDDRPLAFCAGLLRPRIFVSRTTVTSLSRSELGAVVAHEAHHQRRFDPFRLSIMRVMVDSLFFLPMLDELSQKCIERAEIAADRAASQRPGGRQALASALLTLHEHKGSAESIPLSVERIDGLSGRRSFWVPSRSASLLTLASLGVLLAGSAIAVELVTRMPVGIEALGLHICLAALIVAPLLFTAGFAWTRPNVRI
ncbi:MAG: M56 family metallopeptidase [Solirubrobacterales bacterium]|nr:M56 family metallopeptidase [Solirubrobacterales bacterium]